MGKRLDLDDRAASDLFGVDVEPRKKKATEDEGIKVKVKKDDDPMSRLHKGGKDAVDRGERRVRGVFARVGAWFSAMTPAQRSAVGYGVGGVLLGGLAVGVVAKATRPTSPAEPKPAPAPPAPGSATAHAGSVLVVKVKGGGNGVLREKATKQSAKLAELPTGTAVTVIDSAQVGADRWYQVSTPKGQGWMHGAILAAKGGA